MTDEELKRLRELADAATPGPWFSFSEAPPPTCVVHVDSTDELGRLTDDGKILANIRYDNGFSFKDADFIAAARTAVPALLDEVERLLAIVRDLARYEPKAWRNTYIGGQPADSYWCIMCDEEATETEQIKHAETCPWRRAVEAMR